MQTSYGQTGNYQQPGYNPQQAYSNNGSSYPSTNSYNTLAGATQSTYQQAPGGNTYGGAAAAAPQTGYQGGYQSTGNPPPSSAPSGYSQPDGGQGGYKQQLYQSNPGEQPAFGGQAENLDRRGGGGGGHGGGYQSNPGGYGGGGGGGGGGYRGGDDRYGGSGYGGYVFLFCYNIIRIYHNGIMIITSKLIVFFLNNGLS